MARFGGGPQLGKLVFGLALILAGVLFTLDNLDVLDAHMYLRYWPVLLILYGLARLADPRRAGGRFFGFVLAVAGVLFLLKNIGSIHWNVWDLWPLLLALLGISILSQAIFGHSFARRHPHRFKVTMDGATVIGDDPPPSGETVSESVVDVHTFFGDNKRVVATQDFRGGKVSVSMGSCKLDLRQASIAGEQAVLDVQTLMGGVEIRVPVDWKVVVRVNSVLGGVEDSTNKPAGSAKTLVITGDAVMGGVEVRN